MSLFQSLLESQKEARKNKNQEKLLLLQVLLAAIKNKQIAEGRELTDSDVVKVIGHQVKQLRDALIDFEKAKRTDLIDKTKREIEILSPFLPKQMNKKEIGQVVRDVIEEIKPQGRQDFGRVMGIVMQKVKDRADGNQVKEIIQNILSPQ